MTTENAQPAEQAVVNYGETHSSVTAFRACPRMGFYKYRAGGFGIRPTVASKSLVIGSAYHRAMKFLGNVWADKPTPAELGPAIRAAVDDYIEHFGFEMNFDFAEVCAEHAYGLAMCHTKKFALDMPQMNFLAVEKSFNGHIGNREFRGQIDGIVEIDGQRLLLEHKTKSIIPSNLLDLLAVDGQLLRYWYFNSSENLDGVLYTCARKSMIRLKAETKKQAAETHEEFIVRLRAEYDEAGAAAIHHAQVLIDSSDVRECLRGTAHTVDMIAHFDKLGRYPKYEHSCEGKYGPCEFFGVCHKLKWDGSGDAPDGFNKKTVKHEELEELEGDVE